MHDKRQSVSHLFHRSLLHTNTAMKTLQTITDTYDSRLQPPIPTLYSLLESMGKAGGGT